MSKGNLVCGMSHDANPDLDVLVAHEAWVRRLARRMVSDADRADDLVQDTWLSAIRSKWRRQGSPRSFLAGVMRRRALHESRARGRRSQHEALAEPRGVERSAAEALEHAEMGRELTRFLVELEEPFRSVVLLKIQTDLPASAIAERLGIPVKTVESRLARGLARLRERWKRRHPDDSRAWLLLLARLPTPEGMPPVTSASVESARIASTSSSPALGALIVNTKLILVSLAVVGGGGLAYVMLSASDDGRRTPSQVRLESTGGLAPPANTTPLAKESATRAALAAGPAEEPPDVNASPSAKTSEDIRRLRGRVVDPEGRGLTGVAVTFHARGEDRARTISERAGRFELFAPREAGRIGTADPSFEDLFVLHVRAEDRSTGRQGGDNELLLVAARHRPLSGFVVDEADGPMHGVSVGLELPDGFTARFDAVLDGADDRVWRVETDRDGRFELERVPVVSEALVIARLEGYEPATLLPPLGPAYGLELMIRRPESNEDMIEGRVLDLEGTPVSGALVSLGKRAATTAKDGTFRLDRTDAGGAFELVAATAGHLPGRSRALPDPETGEPRWPDWVELVLGESPLALGGRVVDTDGAPRSGLRLWIDDPTNFGVIGDDLTVQLENLAAPVDSTYADSSDDYFRWTATDEDGRFVLQGLLERDYTIGVLDPDRASTTRHGPFAAGRTDVTIQLSRLEPRRIAGRVVSRKGIGLEGVRLGLHCPLFGGVHHKQSEVATDAEGHFSFDGISGTEITLWIRGEHVVPSTHGVAWPAEEEGKIVVDALCHLKVDLTSDPALAHTIHVVDENDDRVSLRDIGANGFLMRYSWELIDGRSITLGVSESAEELVLLKNEKEVRRIALVLRPGRLEIVTP